MDQTLVPTSFFDAVPHWLSPGDCNIRYPLFGVTPTPGGDLQSAQSAGCSAFFKSLAENPAAFSSALDVVLNGPFALTKIRSDIDAYAKFLQPHIDATAKDDSAQWIAGVIQLKADIPLLHNKANGYKL